MRNALLFFQNVHLLITRLIVTKITPLTELFCNFPLADLSCLLVKDISFRNHFAKCTEKPQSSISTHPFSDVPFFSKISKPTGYNQEIGKQCFLPPLSFKISLGDTSLSL